MVIQYFYHKYLKTYQVILGFIQSPISGGEAKDWKPIRDLSAG